MYRRKLLLSTLLMVACFTASTQSSIYTFQKDDAALKEKYYKDAAADKDNLIKSLGKEHKSDYKAIYESRFEVAAGLLQSRTFVTEPSAHNYLQSLLQKIVASNAELKDLKIRLIFTREGWANAFSIGDGTLAVNAAFFIQLENEAQLAFAICHEIAHLYLDHSGKRIRQGVELANSDELKKELKSLSKEKYKTGEKWEALVKRYAMGFFRHSRDAEREADAYAFRFMKNSGFDCKQVITCFRLLEKMNDSTDFNQVDIKKVFNSSDYPFKEKWIKQESSIFSSMSNSDASSLTKAERDSMRTHPDIPERIRLLEQQVNEMPAGNHFLVDEKQFHDLKKQFVAEIVEQVYEYNNLSGYLFLAIQLLEEEGYKEYAAYAVLRSLNKIYYHQKFHSLGLVTEKETRYYSKEYNLLLRMIDRLKLDDIANLAFQFAKKYNHLSSYKEFAEEMRIAQKNKSEN